MSNPLKVFLSYSHVDEVHRAELEKHLKILQRAGRIAPWHDRKIAPGSEWKGVIDENLEQADVILLLVSPDFINSDYCWDIETRRALEKHDERSARVIPIILRPCDWQNAPFAKLQGLPKDGKPITRWDSTDEAWTDVAKAIRVMVEEIEKRKRP